MTRKLTLEEKLNRTSASRACVFCHKKHLQCSNERPCKNCVKRGIPHECQDIERKRAKYLKLKSSIESDVSSTSSVNKQSFSSQVNSLTASPTVESPLSQVLGIRDNNKQMVIPDTRDMTQTTDEVLQKLFTEMKPSLSQDYNKVDQLFDSNYLDEEYKMLGDIITKSMPASPSLSLSHDSVLSDTPSYIVKSSNSRPFISFGTQETTSNDETAIDRATSEVIQRSDNEDGVGSKDASKDSPRPEHVNEISSHFSPNNIGYVSPMISHQMFQSVKDIYSNEIYDFNYPQSYHSLTYFLKTRFGGNNVPETEKQRKRSNLLIILKLIASYRPTFISAHKNLYKPWDLQFLEMSFQRSLLDVDKLSNLNSSPTIIWRRTGEIVSISNELISILGLSMNEILSKRTFIIELMYDDESIINYFKLFKSIAVGNLRSSIVTKIKLIKADGNFIEFCSVWTVKRDIFDLPMLILGQFLPILQSDILQIN